MIQRTPPPDTPQMSVAERRDPEALYMPELVAQIIDPSCRLCQSESGQYYVMIAITAGKDYPQQAWRAACSALDRRRVQE